MDDIFDFLFGPWAMVLLGAAVLAGVAVLVPITVIFSLRVIESAITGSRNALRVGLHGLVTRVGTRRQALQLRLHISRGRGDGTR